MHELFHYLNKTRDPFFDGIFVNGTSVFIFNCGGLVYGGKLTSESLSGLMLAFTNPSEFEARYGLRVLTLRDGGVRVTYSWNTHAITHGLSLFTQRLVSYLRFLRRMFDYDCLLDVPRVLYMDELKMLMRWLIETYNRDYPGFFGNDCKLGLTREPIVDGGVVLRVDGNEACLNRTLSAFKLSSGKVSVLDWGLNTATFQLPIE